MTNQNLLASWKWFFVCIESQGENMKFILDENEYENFLQRLEKWERHIKVGKDYYFWSDIKRFWEIEFEEWVLTQLRELPTETQDFIKKRIRAWHKITTLDNLRSEVAFFNSK